MSRGLGWATLKEALRAGSQEADRAPAPAPANGPCEKHATRGCGVISVDRLPHQCPERLLSGVVPGGDRERGGLQTCVVEVGRIAEAQRAVPRLHPRAALEEADHLALLARRCVRGYPYHVLTVSSGATSLTSS